MNFDFFKDSKNQRIILYVLIFIVAIILFKCNSDKNKNIDILKNNIEALKDTVKNVKTKNGQSEVEKMVFIGDINILKKLSDSLAKEVEKEKGNVKILIKYDVTFKHDTIYIDSTKGYRLNDSLYRLDWNYKHYSRSLTQEINGLNYFTIDYNENIKNPITILTEDCITLNLVTGIKEVDNTHKIFIRLKETDDEDYITFSKVEGAELDESLFTKPKWSIGVFGGFGISGPVNEFKFYPTINWTIGIGLHYSLITF